MGIFITEKDLLRAELVSVRRELNKYLGCLQRIAFDIASYELHHEHLRGMSRQYFDDLNGVIKQTEKDLLRDSESCVDRFVEVNVDILSDKLKKSEAGRLRAEKALVNLQDRYSKLVDILVSANIKVE